MALHSKADFAKLCGMTASNLHNYIHRDKKVIMSGDYIDDSHPINKLFLEKRKAKVFDEKPKPINVSVPNNTQPVPKVEKPEPGTDDYIKLDRKLKAQQLEKIEVETRLLELKEAKMNGELIPTELVQAVYMQQNQSFITSFNNSIDDFLTLFSKKKGLSHDETVAYRSEIIKIINEASKASIEITKTNIQNIIDEFTIKKEVGEHE